MAERSLTYVNRFTTPRFTLAHNFQERTVVTRTVAGWRAAHLCEQSQVSVRDHEHARRTEVIGPRAPEFHLKTA